MLCKHTIHMCLGTTHTHMCVLAPSLSRFVYATMSHIAHTHTCVCVCVFVYTHIQECLHIYVCHTHTCVCVSSSICVSQCHILHTHTHVCVCLRVHTHICVSSSTHMSWHQSVTLPLLIYYRYNWLIQQNGLISRNVTYIDVTECIDIKACNRMRCIWIYWYVYWYNT